MGPERGEHIQMATMPAGIVDGHGQTGPNGHGKEEGEGGEGTMAPNAGKNEEEGKCWDEEKPEDYSKTQVQSHRCPILAVPFFVVVKKLFFFLAQIIYQVGAPFSRKASNHPMLI
jgi:hypothetical protein